MALDQHDRRINYLRVSLTDARNLRCVYCIPEHMTFRPGDTLFQYDEILQLISVFAGLGFKKIRFTSGEPNLRRNVVELIRAVVHTPGGDLADVFHGQAALNAYHRRHDLCGRRGRARLVCDRDQNRWSTKYES